MSILYIFLTYFLLSLIVRLNQRVAGDEIK